MRGIKKSITFIAGGIYASLIWLCCFLDQLTINATIGVLIAMSVSSLAVFVKIFIFILKNWDKE